jgi:hypothetical protein
LPNDCYFFNHHLLLFLGSCFLQSCLAKAGWLALGTPRPRVLRSSTAVATGTAHVGRVTPESSVGDLALGIAELRAFSRRARRARACHAP